MVKLKNLHSVGQARTYFKEHLAAGKETYYSQDGVAQGQWRGQLAHQMGLSGPVTAEQFDRLIEGQHPVTGEQLIRKTEPYKYIVQRGKHKGEERETKGHRPGYDMTVSAPKSISWQYIRGGDERIREVFDSAAARAAQEMEHCVKARIGGRNPDQSTGQMVAVSFQHDAARPVNGYVSPQLHEHFIIANMTKTEDGRWRSVQNDALYDEQNRVGKTAFYSELATGLRRIGYEIEVQEGVPELKGYSREFIEDASKRHDQIEAEGKKLGSLGKRAAARNHIALATRESKKAVDHEFTRHTSQEMEAKFEIYPRALAQQAREKGNLLEQAPQRQQIARAAFDYSRDHNFEKEATVSQFDVIRDAARRSDWRLTTDDLNRELQAREQSGEFQERSRAGYDRLLTTAKHIEVERHLIQKMQQGQDTQPPMASDPQKAYDRAVQRPEMDGIKPNADQEQAIKQLISSRDQIQAFQASAGTGKTTAVRFVAAVAKDAEYEVKGMAPMGRATKELGAAGIDNVENLQKHLARGESAHQGKKLCLFVDEASLSSSQDMEKLVAGLRPGDRVILVGDSRQHQSVGAGKAFEQLQDAGMKTATLGEIMRQRNNPELKQVAEDLSQGRLIQGFERLQSGGHVHVIRDPQQRLAAVTKDYSAAVAQGKSVGVVAPDNARKRELNESIRTELKTCGLIQGPDHTGRVLVARQELSKADRAWAATYQAGDIIRYQSDSPKAGIRRDDYARVVATDQQRNTITVEHDGREIAYDPARRDNVAVYREETRAFAVGDRVQFTDQWKQQDVPNRQMGTIQSIDEAGVISLKLDGKQGRELRFQLSDCPHVEHGYAGTSHTWQGSTVDRVIADVGTETTNPNLVDGRMLYVSMTRGKEQADFYTDNAERAKELVTRETSKTTAIDATRYRKDVNQRHPVEVTRELPALPAPQLERPWVRQAQGESENSNQPSQPARPEPRIATAHQSVQQPATAVHRHPPLHQVHQVAPTQLDASWKAWAQQGTAGPATPPQPQLNIPLQQPGSQVAHKLNPLQGHAVAAKGSAIATQQPGNVPQQGQGHGQGFDIEQGKVIGQSIENTEEFVEKEGFGF